MFDNDARAREKSKTAPENKASLPRVAQECIAASLLPCMQFLSYTFWSRRNERRPNEKPKRGTRQNVRPSVSLRDERAPIYRPAASLPKILTCARSPLFPLQQPS